MPTCSDCIRGTRGTYTAVSRARIEWGGDARLQCYSYVEFGGSEEGASATG